MALVDIPVRPYCAVVVGKVLAEPAGAPVIAPAGPVAHVQPPHTVASAALAVQEGSP